MKFATMKDLICERRGDVEVQIQSATRSDGAGKVSSSSFDLTLNHY